MPATAQQAESKIGRIRQVLEDGEEHTVEEVAEATRMDRSYVSVALAAEVRAHRLNRVRTGVYRVTPTAEEPSSAAGTQPKRGGRPSADRPALHETLVLKVLAHLRDRA